MSRCNLGGSCTGRNSVPVLVTVPADLAAEGRDKRKVVPVDACIADIVSGLASFGVVMRGSCCGHGEDGEIVLHDGTSIRLLSPTEEPR